MAYTRLSMRKTREILRLHHIVALSNRAIARSLKLSPATVSDCLARARAAGVRWPLPATMTDTALEQVLYPPPSAYSGSRPLPDWSTVHRELKGKGVTLMNAEKTQQLDPTRSLGTIAKPCDTDVVQ